MCFIFRLPDIEPQKGTTGAAPLAGEGPLAGDKRGYKYPLGGIWKEKSKGKKQGRELLPGI